MRWLVWRGSFSLPLFLYGALAAVAHRLDMPGVAMTTAAFVSLPMLAIAPELASLQILLLALVFEGL